MDADTFVTRLKRRGYRELGAGMYSTVLAKGDSKRVIKVCRYMDDWPGYVMWSSKAGYAGGLAPRVYSLKVHGAWYVAVMERLDCTVGACGNTDTINEWRTLSSAMGGYPLGNKLPPAQEEFVKTFRAANLGRTDVHDQNFMTRHDGTLVCTDPIGSNSMTWLSNNTRRQRSHDLARL